MTEKKEDCSTDNMKTWDRFADIDPKFTKPISGRDYQGTSPNPQYVIMCLTEMFGPVGLGFGWNVVAEGFQPFGDTVLHWCRLRFWWRDGDDVCEYEEYGQTKAAFVTNAGKHRVDEDAPKKSQTDAIVKAASHLGIAANIFLGRWDDQKYVSQVNEEYRKKEASSAPPRDPMKVRDNMLASISAKTTIVEIEAMQQNKRFDADWEWLNETDPPKAAEVTAAINAKLEELRG